MTNADQTLTRPAAEFRAAEGNLMARFGVKASERFLELEAPRARLRVLESGAGPSTLWVHGGGGCGALFLPLLAKTPSRRHLVIDRPGCGLSDFVDVRQVDFRAHAVDVLTSTLDRLGLDSVDIVANSMGGLWSLWLALARPERVRSLALLGAPAFVGGGSAPTPMRLLGKPLVGALMMKLEPPSTKQVRTLWQRMGHDPQKLDDEIHALMLALEGLPQYAVAWRNLLGRVLTLSGPRSDVVLPNEELKRLEIPITWVWGSSDPFGDVELGRAAAACTAGGFHVAGVGHLPWLDNSEGCARLLKEHWRVSSTASSANRLDERPVAAGK